LFGDGLLDGYHQPFGLTGYQMLYDIQYPNLTDVFDAYTEDLEFLRSVDWISKRTRIVELSFAAYNGNYDLWVMSRFVLEMSVNGAISPSYTLDALRIRADDATENAREDMNSWRQDTTRLVLALLVLFYHVTREVLYEWNKTRRVWYYLLNVMGLVDLGTFGLYIAIHVLRWWHVKSIGVSYDFGTVYQDRNVFDVADLLFLEAMLLALCIVRLLSFARLNRNVFLIWKSVTRSFGQLLMLIWIACPMFVGILLMAHALWSSSRPQFRTLAGSAMGLLMALMGDVDVLLRDGSVVVDPWSVLIVVLYMGIFFVLLMCSWTAVLALAYQTTRVEGGYDLDDYKWKEYDYVTWLLPAALARLYVKYVRKSIRPPIDDDEE